MLLCIYLTMGFLLYDLYFDIVGFLALTIIRLCILWWLFCMSILFLQWFQYLSQAFQTFHVPSASLQSPHFFGNTNPSLLWAKSKTLHVVKMLVSSVLSFFIIHFKVRVIQNFNLSNFLVSLLALTTIIFYTDFSVLQESILCMVSLRQMIKYRPTLNCLLEMLLLPAVINLKLFLSLLDPVYNILLRVKPQFKFSLVQYFWRLKSQLFFSCLMTICLFVSHGFLLNLGITKNCSLKCEL